MIPRHVFNEVDLNRIVGKAAFLVRIVLIACISIAAVTLALTSFASGEPDNIGAFLLFLVFYSILWGTVPSMVLIVAIALDNKYRKKTMVQPIRTEVKLLAIDIAIILHCSINLGQSELMNVGQV